MLRVIGRIAIGLVAVIVLLVLTALVYRPDPHPLRLPRATATIDGTQLSYHQRGTGPDVVLLHGGMGSAEDFEPVLDALAERFRTTAVDRPGFGLSHASGDDPTYPGNARLVAGLIDELGLEHPIVVGHSHGGGVALALAQEHPDLPAALVLVAPAAYPGNDAGFADRLLALPLLGDGLATWLGPLLGPPTIEGILTRMIGPDAGHVPADFIAYRQQLWSNPRSLAVHSRQQTTNVAGLSQIAARLPEVRVPTIIVACAEDPEEGHGLDSRRLARELPGSELRWLQRCGHYVQYGRPADVVAAVVAMSRS